MKNATPHRRKGFLKKTKAPRGAYTYLRAPVILTDECPADTPVAFSFTPPALSACRDYGLPARRMTTSVFDARTLFCFGFFS